MSTTASTVRVGEVNLACEVTGSGDPVILVMGLGTTKIGWAQQVEELSRHYTVLTFDNRGAGESDVPDRYWSVSDMASDTLGLADHFGFDRFHLVGVSMGGMIAQELTITRPQRVRSLALISTYAAGEDRPPISMQVVDELFIRPKTFEERLEAGIRIIFSETFRREHPDKVEAAAAFAAEHPASPQGFFSQLGASAQWQADPTRRERLSDIGVPVLIMHGAADLLSPVLNARLLEQSIPGARVRIWPEAGHALIQEHPSEVSSELVKHFSDA